MLTEIHLGNRLIGDGQPAYIVAEIGSNHDQSLGRAFTLIEAAAEAGVDAVKFQTFRASQLYSRLTPGFSYLDDVDTYALLESLELNRSWHEQLRNKSLACGVEMFSSPFDLDAVAELDQLGVPLLKLASFDLPDSDLVRAMARTGKPLVMSTGLADWMDIQVALDAAAGEGNEQIVLLQCTSLYPAPTHLSNLSAMESMRKAFGTLVGYSDHTMGDHVSIAAVAMGACLIEKHFTLDRTLPGPDHPFAIEPDELTLMVKRIRDVESAMGDGRKVGPRPEEEEMALKARRSLHAAVEIPAGTLISREMLTVKRPGMGLSPTMREHVLGRLAKRTIREDEWITWELLE